MKYLITYLLTSVCLLFTGSLFSQSATTMQDILSDVTVKVKDLEEIRYKEIVNITVDLLTGVNSKKIIRLLDPYFTYDIVAFGDRRINRLKLSVSRIDNTTGQTVPVNEYTAQSPEIRIKPSAYEEYEFMVSVDEYREGDRVGHFAVIIYHENPEISK